MLKNTSKEFREFFLLAFTKEILANTKTQEIENFRENLKQEKIKQEKEKLPKVKELSRENPSASQKTLNTEKKSILPRKSLASTQEMPLPKLKIPRPSIPETYKSIFPVSKARLNLGKINSLLENPAVRAIDCEGPGKSLTIQTDIEKKSSIVLTKEEIENIVHSFELASNTKAEQGVYRANVGKYYLSAILSEVLGIRFRIWKKH